MDAGGKGDLPGRRRRDVMTAVRIGRSPRMSRISQAEEVEFGGRP
jgi:hypothetical protein